MSKKIAMIGCGKLGLPCAEVMSSKYRVWGYDPIAFLSKEIHHAETVREAVVDADIVFIAVPTPHDSMYDGRRPTSHLEPKDFDYSYVRDSLDQVSKYVGDDTVVALISTVLPGTIRKEFYDIVKDMNFVYNPYLIAMGTVKEDMVDPEMVIIGTENGQEDWISEKLIGFYESILGEDVRYELGTWEEAESIKIFYNTMISTKIGMANMIQDVAQKLGNMNVDVVTSALAKSTMRITGPKYMTAGLGDSGGCVLPEFEITINDKKTSIKDFYESFSDSEIYLTPSTNYSATCVDEKKIDHPTSRDYDGEILEFETETGQHLICTPDHLIPVKRKGKRILVRADEIKLNDKFFTIR